MSLVWDNRPQYTLSEIEMVRHHLEQNQSKKVHLELVSVVRYSLPKQTFCKLLLRLANTFKLPLFHSKM